jgi:Methyltransferase domain
VAYDKGRFAVSGPRALLGRLVDRLCDRFIDRQISRFQRRLLHPNMVLLADARKEAAAYVREYMPNALAIMRREDSLRIAFGRAPPEGLILEFGVGGGDSIRRIAAMADGRAVHGFDSFEGLPEDWAGRHEERGHYSLGGRLPDVPANVVLHKGLFAETLPAFLDTHDGACALVHIDCDLYASARTVLDALGHRIRPGTIIVFDEYFNYPTWRDHEHKAFQEFVAANGVAYDYFLWGGQEVAVVIRTVRQGSPRPLEC